MQGDRVREWVARYERAWRTAGTDGLSALFTDDAVYLRDPYAEPIRGLPAIAEFWEAERDGPDEVFTLTAEVVAEQGDRGVARIEVVYGDLPMDERTIASRGADQPQRGRALSEYRDLRVITFDDAGRARAFEEWPFFPGRPRAAGGRAGADRPDDQVGGEPC
jgi:hypothetical protein